MNIKTISPFDVLTRADISNQESIRYVPVQACYEHTDAYAVNEDYPENKFNETNKA
jgi:hypothetical protein